MKIRDLQQKAYRISQEHGWYESNRSVGDVIALMHSELSEALEEWRDGRPLSEVRFAENGKPEGFPVELADCIIRILDSAERYGIDMEAVIDVKMKYNETRTYRHGGKRA